MTSASLENIKNIFWGETDFPKQAYQQPMEKTQGAVGSKKCGWPITRSQKAWKFPMGRMMAIGKFKFIAFFLLSGRNWAKRQVWRGPSIQDSKEDWGAFQKTTRAATTLRQNERHGGKVTPLKQLLGAHCPLKQKTLFLHYDGKIYASKLSSKLTGQKEILMLQ